MIIRSDMRRKRQGGFVLIQKYFDKDVVWTLLRTIEHELQVASHRENTII